MKRVVLASFDPVPAPKGASQHILANHRILKRDYDVSLITLGQEPIERIRHRPVQLAAGNWLRRAYDFRERVEEIFEKNDFDIYHVRSSFEGLAVPPGKTTIFEVNGLHSVEASYHYPDVGSAPHIREKLRAQELVLLDRASKIITTNRVTARYLSDLGVPASDVALVPNIPSIPVGTTHGHRPDGSPFRACYLGTLAPWQGLYECILALAKVEVPVELTLLTGSGKGFRKSLTRLARKKNVRLRFADTLGGAELAEFLKTQDVGLAPLVPCERNVIMGCMPIKVLDYMAAGLPVVAPDMEVIRDMVGPDYPLYPRYRRRGLSESVAALAQDASMGQQLGKAGLERVKEAYTPQIQAEKLRAIYRGLN